MKVLLLQNVKGVGRKGEIKEVAEGFAHNRLIPQKLAKIATSSTVKEVYIVNESKKSSEAQKIQEFEKFFKEIESQEHVLKQKTNTDGVLFAKCDELVIEKYFKKQGFTKINKEMIKLKEGPIKKVGKYLITLTYKTLKTTYTISIVSE